MWKKMKRRWRRLKRKPEIIFILFIIISNTVLYFHLQNPGGKTATSKTATKELHSKDGEKIPVTPGAVIGFLANVMVRDSAHVEFTGWAFDAWNSCLPERIMLSYDEKIIYRGQTNHHRPGVAKRYGKAALKSGFKFILPLKLFQDKNPRGVRVFAMSHGVASELNYSARLK